ncbi:hypothetical protein QFZ75_004034 [Streptomyces sp. V3I8]|nr:hypothetical protein [Streptomyces sp. V3I8]
MTGSAQERHTDCTQSREGLVTAPVAVIRDTVRPRVTMTAGSAATGTDLDPDLSTDLATGPDPYDGFAGAQAVPQGRAARRRQLARWRKNQRGPWSRPPSRSSGAA